MKKQIIDYLQSEPNKKTNIEDLQEALHISTSKEFKNLIRAVNELLDEARLIENSKHEITLIEHTNYIIGTLDLKEKGFGFVIPEDPSLNDVFISKDNIFDAMNKDKVLVHINSMSKGIRQEGEIKRILDRKYTHIIGILDYKNGMGIIEPDDKTIKNDVVVKRENQNNAKKGDVVRARIINYSFRGKIECTIEDIIGNKKDAGVDILSKILKYNIDPLFPPMVLEEAKQFDVTEEDFKDRRDLRNDLIITIDGDDAKDFDDAVAVKILDNGNYKLGVHIADVSHYVTQGSLLDIEAYQRGTSVYMPGRVVPMLPEHLSNGVCSLRPNEPRLTISCDMEINKEGKVVKYEIYPSVIESKYRMTYNQVNQIFNGDQDLNQEYIDLVGMLYNMWDLAKVLGKKRSEYGSIHFENDESYITLDENMKAVDITLRDRGISQNIIEEFMLKANQVVAEHVFWLNLPFIYRVHDKPKEEKLQKLLRMTNALGYKVKAKSEISNFELQKLLDQIKGEDCEKGVNLLVLRSMQKAIYSDVNLGHYGLSFKYYTHFTSPIRRYPDLIVHRLLREYLFKPKQSLEVIDYYEKHMTDIATQTSATERNAMLCEREVIDMKKAEYISKYINKEFDGIINSITNFGLYVSLENTVEGLVHIKTLNDYFHYDEELMLLIGERSKKIYKVGDHVRVKVVRTNIPEGEVDFIIVKG